MTDCSKIVTDPNFPNGWPTGKTIIAYSENLEYSLRINRSKSMRLFDSGRSRELVHPIRLEKDENDNYLYSKKVTHSSFRKEAYEPKWTSRDVRAYNTDFNSPYIRGCSPPPPRERIIPLRTVYTSDSKPPAYSSYQTRSLNRSSNLRSSASQNVRSEFPEFSSLNSPSKIASTLRRWGRRSIMVRKWCFENEVSNISNSSCYYSAISW